MVDFRPWIERLSARERAEAREQLRTIALQAQLAVAPVARPGPTQLDIYEGVPDMEEFASVMGGDEVERRPGSWLAFTTAKPALRDGVSHVHLFVPHEDVPVPTVWFKARRQQTLAQGWDTQATGEAERSELGNQPVLRWASERAGRSGAPITFGPDLQTRNGPDFLAEPIRQTEGALVFPVLKTDMDLMEPFGGHFYFKFLTPEAALAWARFS